MVKKFIISLGKAKGGKKGAEEEEESEEDDEDEEDEDDSDEEDVRKTLNYVCCTMRVLARVTQHS